MTGRRESLKTVVGEETYGVWTDMLHSLVPEGRTHRLAPMVAGMLQYAVTIAYERYGDNPEEGSVAHSLLIASETYDPEEAEELLGLVKRLFKDAKVKYDRVDHRGDGYSIVESIIYEFIGTTCLGNPECTLRIDAASRVDLDRILALACRTDVAGCRRVLRC